MLSLAQLTKVRSRLQEINLDKFLQAICENDASLQQLEATINNIHEKIARDELKHEEHIIKHEEKHLNHIIKQLNKEINQLKEELEELIIPGIEELTNGTINKKLYQIRQAEKRYAKQELTRTLQYYFLAKNMEGELKNDPDIQEQLTKGKEKINKTITQLKKINDYAKKYAEKITNYFNIIQEYEPTTINLNLKHIGQEEIIIDTSFIAHLAKELEKKDALIVHTNKAVIVPLKVIKEAKKQSSIFTIKSKSLIKKDMLNTILKTFKAKEKGIHLNHNKEQNIYSSWLKADKAKHMSINRFLRTADAKILAYTLEHKNILILTNDKEIAQTIERSPEFYGHYSLVLKFENGKLRKF